MVWLLSQSSMPVIGYTILRPTLMCGMSPLRVSFLISDKDTPVSSETSDAEMHVLLTFIFSHLLLIKVNIY